MTAMTASAVKVLVMAPHLGTDLSYVTEVDPRVEVLDGNEMYRAELAEQGRVSGSRVSGSRVSGPQVSGPQVSGPQVSGSRISGPASPGAPSRAQRDRLLAEADVLLVGYPVPGLLAQRATSLRWAHHTQAGVSNLVQSDLWTSPVALTSSRGAVGVTAIAEYVMAGVFAFARGMVAAARDGDRELDRDRYRQMTSVAGATMGIVGLGGIGQEVARLARAVGMRVVGTRRSVTEPQTAVSGADLVLPASGLLEMAGRSDVVVVCSQLTPETRGMIHAGVFAAMRRGSVLINVARGEEVDEPALLDAVRSGHLRGALLDVYDGELAGRPPRPELLAAPGIMLTPHISGSGHARSAEPVRRLFAENLRRFLDGEPLANLVDRARGY